MMDSSHVIVTRFAVPRAEGDTDGLYRNRDWLHERLALFRKFYVPSVAPLKVPAILLCGRAVVDLIRDEVADLEWAEVVAQDQWHGGWSGSPEQTLTRLDSDDAVHRAWFQAVDEAPAEAEVLITKEFLRWDPDARRLHKYRRKEPSPLAAFRGGVNPYSVDHKFLERDVDGVHPLWSPFLLQVAHGGNIANRRPSAWRIDRRASLSCLKGFGLA